MNITTVRNDYDYHSGKVSDITRQLNFAGIAIIWLFKIGESHHVFVLPNTLLYCLVLFVFSLSFDLLQYLYYSFVWSFLARLKERKGLDKKIEFKVSRSIHWIPLTFFWGKAIICIGSYGILISYIIKRINVVIN